MENDQWNCQRAVLQCGLCPHRWTVAIFNHGAAYDGATRHLRDGAPADYASMQARNNLLKDLNSALATMRAERPNDEKTVRSYGTFIDSQGKTRSVYEFLQANGIAIETNCNDVYGIQAEFDAAINNVRAAIDSANSEGQMAVISLQGLLDKLNQVTELTSNVLSKDEKANEAVIGNIR